MRSSVLTVAAMVGMVTAVPAATAAALASTALATTASATTGAAAPAGTSYTIEGSLNAVSATSASNAWAVGTTDGTDGQGLTVHWNGRSWRRVASPAPKGSTLFAVSATSASDAWAIGTDDSTTFTLHWNGRAWSKISVPVPGPGLAAVSATSPGNAWAVGDYLDSSGSVPGSVPAIVHWNGKRWSRVAIPQVPGPSDTFLSLTSVYARSASDAWIVGGMIGRLAGGSVQAVILHWNGKAWKPVSATVAKAASLFNGVAASSATSAWAVGCACGTPFSDTAVVGHWNGKTWSKIALPLKQHTDTTQVAAIGGSVWVSGTRCVSDCSGFGETDAAVLLRWTGKAWQLTKIPAKNDPEIAGVTVTSPGNAWAVGSAAGSSLTKTVILHWNGKAWK